MYKIKIKYYKSVNPELKFWATLEVLSVDVNLKDSINHQVLPDIEEGLILNLEKGFSHTSLPTFSKIDDLTKFVKDIYIPGIMDMVKEKRSIECEKVILPDEKIIEL